MAPARFVSPKPALWALPLTTLLLVSLLGASTSTPITDSSGSQINAGDTAWMLTATALVLLMTPGLSFFYGGMVDR